MKPLEVFSLWRDRWGKSGHDGRAPFLTGRPYQWGQRLSDWPVWDRPGASVSAALVVLLIATWTATLRFSVGAQLGFSLVVLVLSVLAVRYKGRLIALLILALSAVMTARYFYWRLGQTVPLYPMADFVGSLVLCMVEVFFWCLLSLATLRSILQDCKPESSTLPTPRWMAVMRAGISMANEILLTYRPLAMGLLCIVPMAFVLGGVRTLPTQLTWLLLMGTPHWLLMYLQAQRVAAPGRPNLALEAQTVVSALAVLVRTAWSWLRTGLTQRNRRLAWSAILDVVEASPIRVVAWMLAWLCVATGSLGMMRAQAGPELSTLIYIVWCALVGLMLSADFAIAAESRSVLAQHQRLTRVPAMILRASGHTIHCQTLNFPDTELVLSVPMSSQIGSGDRVAVCVFHGGSEFHFPASVLHAAHERLTVLIDESAHAQVQAAVQNMRVRDEKWPRWLPGPYADRLMPNWLVHPIMNAFSTVSLQVAQNGVRKTMQHLFSQLVNRKPT